MENKIFITANLFFGRKQALKLPKRTNFKDVNEMNVFIGTQWNKQVSPNDIVYVLGGFAHDPISCNNSIERLNGNIVFLNCALDKSIHDVAKMYTHTIIAGEIIEIPNKNSVLCYYPLEVWQGKNSYHFFGSEKLTTDLNRIKNRMNVSFDNFGRLVTPEECIEMIEIFKKTTRN